MKALVYARYGGPEVLQIAECPIPRPGPLDVVIRVRAATVGIGDCKTRAGLLQNFHALKLPTVPGRYGVGEIASVRAEVGAVAPGDGVVFATLHTDSGSNAEYVRVLAEKTARKPRMLSDVETASLLQGATCAYICLVETAAAAMGQNLLIHGAAGSVGSACVELARHLGCHINATCRDGDRDYVRSLGADDVVAFDREDLPRWCATRMRSSTFWAEMCIAGPTACSGGVDGSFTSMPLPLKTGARIMACRCSMP
jgi:NADPH:quinone reductase-like Zn-dependent oxidoreductase